MTADPRLAEVVESLVDALTNDESPEVRAEAAQSLGVVASVDQSQRTDVRQALLDALEDSNGLPRKAAAWALGSFMDGSVAARLIELLEHSPELWSEVASALSAAQGIPIEAELSGIL